MGAWIGRSDHFDFSSQLAAPVGMTALTLLLPSARKLAATDGGRGWLDRLGQADRLPDQGAPLAALAGGVFTVVPSDFSEAAVRRHGEADDAGDGVWLCADPCWLVAEPTGLRMMAGGAMQLSALEAEDFAAVLAPIFGDAGIALRLGAPDHWYLQLPAGAELPRFSPLREVLGDDIERHLPVGKPGLRWRHLHNEVQMSLHQHRHNQRRAERGLAPVNSLWFWGGGRLPNRVGCAQDQLLSDDLLVRGLARLAAVPCGAVTTLAAALTLGPRVAVDLRDASDLEALTNTWLLPALAALRHGPIRSLQCGFDSGECCRLRAWHRWRFWRRGWSPTTTAGGAR